MYITNPLSPGISESSQFFTFVFLRWTPFQLNISSYNTCQAIISMNLSPKMAWFLPDYSIASLISPNITCENRDSCHLFNVLLANMGSQRGWTDFIINLGRVGIIKLLTSPIQVQVLFHYIPFFMRALEIFLSISSSCFLLSTSLAFLERPSLLLYLIFSASHGKCIQARYEFSDSHPDIYHNHKQDFGKILDK